MAVMNKSELYEWAKIGINSEIDRRYENMQKAQKYLIALKEGRTVQTKLTVSELQQVITRNKREIEELSDLRYDLAWELAVNGEE